MNALLFASPHDDTAPRQSGVRSAFRRGMTLLLALLLVGCSSAMPFAGQSAPSLGPNAVRNPMLAAEAYMQQYQPGPTPRVFQTTRLYDRSGALIAEMMDEGRRVWAPLENISPHLVEATVATEDSTFFSNSGVDPARIAGAALRNLQQGQIVSGASTITMQLARNLFLGDDQRYDQSMDRKLLEAGLAQELTSLYTKNELLEMYLNLLNYGQLAYGPEAAAQVYFGKSAAELTLAEATLLAGIPQAPALLNPYQDMPAARNRQRIVLNLMVRHGYLSEAEADAVYAEELTLAGDPGLAPNRAPHFTQYVVEFLGAELGESYVRRAGLNIYTTLDLPIQEIAQATVTAKVAELQPQFDLSNAALVAMRPGSGEILAMVGSADFTSEAIAGQVNVALARRQPGSAIKPILYAAALDDNLISPASVLWDTPITYTVGPNDVYTPRNYDERFHGPVTVRSALANSYNIPAVKLLDALGVERMLEQARSMGIASLDRDRSWYGLSLTLGGGEVTLLELTTAYNTLASEGRLHTPTPIVRVADALGRELTIASTPAPVQAVKPATTFLLSVMLSDNDARTPAFGSNSPLGIVLPAAAKTGTTSDFRDNWTLGYTRFLTAGVWAGNSDGRPMRGVSGVTGAAPIWHDFMRAVLEDPQALAALEPPANWEAWAFPPADDVQRRQACPPSLDCWTSEEYYSAEWLAAAGAQSPIADSTVNLAAAPVYALQGDGARLVGYCGVDGGLERTLLRLPAGLGWSAAVSATAGASLGSDELGRQPGSVDSPDLYILGEPNPEPPPDTGLIAGEAADGPAWNAEQLYALAWVLTNGAPVDLGRCDQLQPAVAQAAALSGQSGNLRLVVDLAAAAQEAPPPAPGPGAVELASISPGAAALGIAGPGLYRVAGPVVHDNDCPGAYIMGQVLDAGGAAVAGVRVLARDEWGNEAITASKSGEFDYGRFDFPVAASGSPHTIFVTVVDEGGNPISEGVAVLHRQGEAPDASCHHIVFQGG